MKRAQQKHSTEIQTCCRVMEALKAKFSSDLDTMNGRFSAMDQNFTNLSAQMEQLLLMNQALLAKDKGKNIPKEDPQGGRVSTEEG